MFNGILDHGVIVQHVPLTPLYTAEYAYTVGRTMRGLPELIISGLPGPLAAGILTELDQSASEAGPCTANVEGVAMDFELVPVAPAPAIGAKVAFGAIKLWQAVWQGPGEQDLFAKVGG